MQAVFNTTSPRLRRLLRGLGHHPDADHRAADATAGTTEYLTISDNPDVHDWFANLWRNFAYTPLANLCGIPAISLPMGAHENGLPLGIQAIVGAGAGTGCCCNSRRRSSGRWAGPGTRAGGPACT